LTTPLLLISLVYLNTGQTHEKIFDKTKLYYLNQLEIMFSFMNL